MPANSSYPSHALIGILGGMGPAAGIDLCQKIAAQHPADRDQDHIPFVLYSVPQMPGRTEAILEGTESPLQAMTDGIHALARAGATAVAIACITAHAWLAELRARSPVPILDIVDAVASKLKETSPIAIGLLATQATHRADVFQSRLEALGYRFMSVADPTAHQRAVNDGIRRTKAGDANAGGEILARSVAELVDAGAQYVILGCTEIPVALAALDTPLMQFGLDPTAALADACIEWSKSYATQKRPDLP